MEKNNISNDNTKLKNISSKNKLQLNGPVNNHLTVTSIINKHKSSQKDLKFDNFKYNSHLPSNLKIKNKLLKEDKQKEDIYKKRKNSQYYLLPFN